jgi:hypothetical protein
LDAVKNYHPDLAVLMIPVPQDPACNPQAPKTGVRDTLGCKYAHFALAVWRSSPADFATMDQWLFETDELPDLASVVERTKELRPRLNLDPVISDSDLDGAIPQGLDLYRASGAAKVPALLLPRAIVSGQIPSSEELRAIMAKELGLQCGRSPNVAQTISPPAVIL